MSAKFLEILCDKMEGLIDFASKISIEILSLELIKDPNAVYPLLNTHFDKSSFLQSASMREKVDVCILFLTQLSYIIPKRKAVFESFKLTLEKVTEPII